MKLIKNRIRSFIFPALLAASTALGATAPVSTAAEPARLNDYDWQALYIVKFGLNYVEWPEVTYINDVKVINVCVYGDNPAFSKSLQALQSKASARLKINIRPVTNEEVEDCNIAYIARNKPDYKEILENISSKPVLTVSPINGFAASNGMVEFLISETKEGGAPFTPKVKVNFKINNRIAVASSLKIAPELLELSEEVIR